MQTADQVNVPWYREGMVWLLIAGPAVVVVAGLLTGWLAYATADGLVQDDYYKAGKAINRILTRDAEAARLALSAALSIEADQVRASLASEAPEALPRELRLLLAHPTQPQRDRVVLMLVTGPGLYQAPLAELEGARYYVTLEDPDKRWRLTGQWQVGAGALHLQGAR